MYKIKREYLLKITMNTEILNKAFIKIVKEFFQSKDVWEELSVEELKQLHLYFYNLYKWKKIEDENKDYERNEYNLQ